MDVKRRLPPKVYDEIVLKIASKQDNQSDGQSESEKIKKAIEYEVIPEIEQYVHRISKTLNKAIVEGDSQLQDLEEEETKEIQPVVALGERYAKFNVSKINLNDFTIERNKCDKEINREWKK